MKRRDFMKTSAMGVSALGLTGCMSGNFSLEGSGSAMLNLSSQEGRIPGQSLEEKLDFLELHGFSGIEIGGRGLSDRVTEIQKALNGRGVRVSAICAGFDGVLISEKPDIRQRAMDSMKGLLTAAGALKSTGLIIVPAFNGQTELSHQASREYLVELLPELGAHAEAQGTRLLLEPLNRKEAYFLRLLADAASICRDVDHAGIACMGDFWHMTWEETSDLGAIVSAGDYLHHMHIASRKRRKMPGEDEGDQYVEGFRGLKFIGYQDFLSLECGCVGDPVEIFPRTARLIQEQWAAA